MKRRHILHVSVAAFVAVISLSTVWVTQASSENQAASQVAVARTAVFHALAHARSIGLRPSETADLRRDAQQLEAARVPASLPFWRGDATAFYHRQRTAYRRLVKVIARREITVTANTRAEAGASLARLGAVVTQGRQLDVDVTAAAVTQGRQEAFLRSGPDTPAHYRAVIAGVAPVTTQVATAVRGRQTYVASVVAAAHGDVNNVWQRASDEAGVASGQAGLIALFNDRGSRYSTALSGALAAVRGQGDVRAAAAKEATLHDLTATIAADFTKTVPAKLILVSTEDQTARMFEGGNEVYSTPVTTGGPELPTDHGVFHIYEKISPFTFHSPWPPGSPYYYAPTDVQYWMPFYEAEGLHDASWRSNFGPGSNLAPTDLGTGNTILGTHGCVNLPTPAAAFVWNWAPVGTTVVVV